MSEHLQIHLKRLRRFSLDSGMKWERWSLCHCNTDTHSFCCLTQRFNVINLYLLVLYQRDESCESCELRAKSRDKSFLFEQIRILSVRIFLSCILIRMMNFLHTFSIKPFLSSFIYLYNLYASEKMKQTHLSASKCRNKIW